MMLLILAVLSGVAGILLLWWSWRAPQPKPPLFMPLGWALLLLSMVLWCYAQGVEFGLVYALMVMTVAAWAVIVAGAETGPVAAQVQVEQPLRRPGWGALGRHSGLFLLVVPVAGVASAFACVGAMRLLPWQPVNSLIAVIVLQPVVWGALAYWFAATRSLWRPLSASIAAGLAGAALVFL